MGLYEGATAGQEGRRRMKLEDEDSPTDNESLRNGMEKAVSFEIHSISVYSISQAINNSFLINGNYHSITPSITSSPTPPPQQVRPAKPKYPLACPREAPISSRP